MCERGRGGRGREMADDEEPEGGQHGDRGEGEEPGGAGVRALAERVRDAEHPGQRGPAVQALPARDADPGAEVVGDAERDQTPAGHDPDRHPRLLVAGRERDGDVERAGVQVGVAEQRCGVHGDRDQRRERECLVGGAQVDPAALHDPPAHRQAHADRRAREQERGGAGGAGGDPEEVLVHAGQDGPGAFALTSAEAGNQPRARAVDHLQPADRHEHPDRAPDRERARGRRSRPRSRPARSRRRTRRPGA